MTITREQFVQGVFLPTTAAVLFTVPTSQTTTIEKVTAYNSNGSARTVTFYLVPTGDSPSAVNRIVSELSIDGGATVDITSIAGHAMNAGMSLQGLCSSANNVSVMASGWRRT